MNVVRDATPADEPFLWRMLGDASRGGGDVAIPESDLRDDPSVARYLLGWGRPGDVGVVATTSDHPPMLLGSAWFRLYPSSDPGYGYVDDETPELSIRGFAAEGGFAAGMSRSKPSDSRKPSEEVSGTVGGNDRSAAATEARRAA